jgi:hypothetical protein
MADLRATDENVIAYELALKQMKSEKPLGDVERIPPEAANAVKMDATFSDVGVGLDTASPSKTGGIMRPGQHSDKFGTIVWNPLDSDPLVERIKGEKKYYSKPLPESGESMRLKLAKMEDDNKGLREQIGMITTMLAQQLQSTPQNPAEIVPDVTQDAQSPYETMKYTDLKKAAAERGINSMGVKKNDLIRALEESGK